MAMRGKLIAALSATLAALNAQGQEAPRAPAGWELEWADEFDGPALDPASWDFDLGGGGWGNAEAQCYTSRPENCRLEGGMLVIEARREKLGGCYYSSARIKTQGLRTFEGGRIEARLKVPAGKGLWPAFWLLGSSIERAGWPACGEIDVVEYIGREPEMVLGTLHGPGYSGDAGLSARYRPGFAVAEDFHVYAVEWDRARIDWFMDGARYNSVSRPDLGDKDWPFDAPFFIVLNLAVGGRLPGPTGLDTAFPARLLVDYVRAYRKAR